MSETMAHNIGHALAALPGTLGYHSDNGCIVQTLLHIDPDSDADTHMRTQAHDSGQRAKMAPGVTTPDGMHEALLVGLPPYWLPLDDIDPDVADHDTMLTARLNGLYLLADMGFDVTDILADVTKILTRIEENTSADTAQHHPNTDSELFSSLRYMIVLIDPDEYEKAHDNDGHLYRIYDRFTQKRSAITPISPAIVVVTDRLETGAGFYALNRLNNMDLFSGTIADIEEHLQTHKYEKLHNQHIPSSQLHARDRYRVSSAYNTTAVAAAALVEHITEYVAAEHKRVVNASESQFFLDKDEPTEEEITISNHAIDAIYRRCVHHLTGLIESAQSLIALNGHGAQLNGSDLRVMLEKTAYLLSYSEHDNLYSMFHEVLEIPLLLATTVDDHTPAEVRRLIGGEDVARIIRITLETLVSLDLTGKAISDDVAHRIRANALRTLICDAAVRCDYTQYHFLTDELDRHISVEDKQRSTSVHVVRDDSIQPGGMIQLATNSQDFITYIAFQLGMYSAQHPEPTDDLTITDDIAKDVAAAVTSSAD